jgi:hypothetical protein
MGEAGRQRSCDCVCIWWLLDMMVGGFWMEIIYGSFLGLVLLFGDG